MVSRELDVQASPRVSKTYTRQAVDCNLCGSNKNTPHCPENGLGLVRCDNCNLIYVGERPEPEALYTLYEESYFQNHDSGVVGYSDYIRDEYNIRKTAQKRAKHIEKFVDPGNMLDVGCAMGFFADEMAQRGWNAAGLDVSSFAVNYIQEQFGHTGIHGSFTDVELEPEAYDLVTMFDVIEHVPDPKAYMEKAAEVLRSGGVFELATPDIGSIPAKLTGKRWIGYKLSEEHIYYFSVETLKQMLDETGFEVEHVRHIGKHVTLDLFTDRLGFYAPFLAAPLNWVKNIFKLNRRSFYINPYDIVAVTARKR